MIDDILLATMIKLIIKKLLRLFLFFSIGIVSSNLLYGQGKVLYVSKNGNDNNVGTISEPLLKISTAALKAVSGDTIKVFPGTYIDEAGFNGKAVSIISIKGADSTTLQGVSLSNFILSYGNTAIGTDSTEVIISGFTFRLGLAGLANNNSTRLKVTNCKFYDNYLGTITEGPATFLNCIFNNNSYTFLMEYQPASANGYAQVFINCTFYKNSNFLERGQEGPVGSRRPQFLNCIIYIIHRFFMS